MGEGEAGPCGPFVIKLLYSPPVLSPLIVAFNCMFNQCE